MRPNNFDLIRLLAALQVVYCHTCWHLGITTGIGDPTVSHLIHWFPGVPIFFTISGFLISRSWERSNNWRDYATKRVLRIYPALWVQLAVGILVATSFGVITPAIAISPSFGLWVMAQSTFVQVYNPSFMRGFGLGVLNGSLWTIPVELGFYVSLPILYLGFVNRVSRRGADFGLGVLSLVSFAYWFQLSKYADPNSNWTKLQMVTPLPHLYMFLVGIMLQRNFESLRPFLESRVLYWLAGFSGCMLLLNPWGPATLSSSPMSVLLARLLLAMTVLSFAFSRRSLSELMLRGNDISYGVYLYHGLVINVLVQLGCKQDPWYLGLVSLVTVVCAALSWWLVESPAVSMKSQKTGFDQQPPPVSIALSANSDSTKIERDAA